MSSQIVGTAARQRVGRSLASIFIMAISVGPLAPPAVSQDIPPLVQVKKLLDLGGFSENRFGLAVALSSDGRTALVGARGDHSLGLHSAGAAHVYRRIQGEWVQEAKLFAPQPIIEGFFGVSIALSANGDLALVGASSFFAFCGEPICGGSAYFFQRDPQGGWHLIQTLMSAGGGLTDAFGASVALSGSGTVAAIGARRAGCPLGDPCGAMFVFVRRQGEWQLEDRLEPQVPDPFVGEFGTAVSLSRSGKTVLIGAVGSAFVFSREGQEWTEQAKLQEPGLSFAGSVALSGNGRIALVGSNGAAFGYRREQGEWSGGQLLPTGTLGVTDVAVAISRSGDRALLG